MEHFNLRGGILIKEKEWWRGGPQSIKREMFWLADLGSGKVSKKFNRITK
jgi:hypothetical protein